MIPGPMPLLGDPGHKDIIKSLSQRVPKILKLGTPDAPRAIVVVTAHWSEDRPTISSGKKHSLYYDYGGFPAATYKLKYDAPGSPEVAEEVRQAFAKAGLDPVMNDKRGTPPSHRPVSSFLPCFSQPLPLLQSTDEPKAGTTASSSPCS